MTSLSRRWIIGAFAVLGLVATLVLCLGSWELTHVTPRVILLAHQADQETYIVGEIAHRIDDISALFDQQPGSVSMERMSAAIAEDLDHLENAMKELTPLLDEEDRPAFSEIVAHVESLHRAVASMLAASPTGYSVESRRIFDSRVMPLVTALESPTNKLLDLNIAESARRLDELRDDLDRFRTLYVALGVFFVAFLITVAVLTLRIIGKQHRALTEHLCTIEQANRDLEAFAGRVAHDLRGPLTPILLAAAQLRSGPHEPEHVEGLATRIIHAAERSERLIKSLLAFSSAERPACGDQTCSAPEVIERALQQVQEAAAAAGIESSVDVDSVHVKIDDSLLEQVLDNLLRNAIRYLGVRPVRRVDVTAKRDKDFVVISVADTGPGVRAEEQEQIFKPFFRLDPRVRGGVGLGLATARRIVEVHGGAMGVEDNPGGGAIFWFTLPWTQGPGAARTDESHQLDLAAKPVRQIKESPART